MKGGSFMEVSSRLFEESSSEVAMRVFLFVTQRVPFWTKRVLKNQRYDWLSMKTR